MTVVVAYRPDRDSDDVLQRGVAEARARGSSVTLVNVARSDAVLGSGRLTEAEELDLLERLHAQGVDASVQNVPESADVGADIVHIADDLNAELIVIGLRHRSRVGKFILGSTAQTVLLHASCDVLSVRVGH